MKRAEERACQPQPYDQKRRAGFRRATSMAGRPIQQSDSRTLVHPYNKIFDP